MIHRRSTGGLGASAWFPFHLRATPHAVAMSTNRLDSGDLNDSVSESHLLLPRWTRPFVQWRAMAAPTGRKADRATKTLLKSGRPSSPSAAER